VRHDRPLARTARLALDRGDYAVARDWYEQMPELTPPRRARRERCRLCQAGRHGTGPAGMAAECRAVQREGAADPSLGGCFRTSGAPSPTSASARTRCSGSRPPTSRAGEATRFGHWRRPVPRNARRRAALPALARADPCRSRAAPATGAARRLRRRRGAQPRAPITHSASQAHGEAAATAAAHGDALPDSSSSR
jgi:hypothetical protein